MEGTDVGSQIFEQRLGEFVAAVSVGMDAVAQLQQSLQASGGELTSESSTCQAAVAALLSTVDQGESNLGSVDGELQSSLQQTQQAGQSTSDDLQSQIEQARAEVGRVESGLRENSQALDGAENDVQERFGTTGQRVEGIVSELKSQTGDLGSRLQEIIGQIDQAESKFRSASDSTKKSFQEAGQSLSATAEEKVVQPTEQMLTWLTGEFTKQCQTFAEQGKSNSEAAFEQFKAESELATEKFLDEADKLSHDIGSKISQEYSDRISEVCTGRLRPSLEELSDICKRTVANAEKARGAAGEISLKFDGVKGGMDRLRQAKGQG